MTPLKQALTLLAVTIVVLGLVGCGISKGEYEKIVSELDKTKAELERARAKMETTEAGLEQANARIAKMDKMLVEAQNQLKMASKSEFFFLTKYSITTGHPCPSSSA